MNFVEINFFLFSIIYWWIHNIVLICTQSQWRCPKNTVMITNGCPIRNQTPHLCLLALHLAMSKVHLFAKICSSFLCSPLTGCNIIHVKNIYLYIFYSLKPGTVLESTRPEDSKTVPESQIWPRFSWDNQGKRQLISFKKMLAIRLCLWPWLTQAILGQI